MAAAREELSRQEKLEDRLLVKDGFRHYRRTYSLSEVRWGLACGALLLGIGLWTWWKGRHPDPELFGDSTALLEGAKNTTVVPVRTETTPVTSQAVKTTAESGRGPLPQGMAGDGWREEKLASFDAENLYVKINGRADYFKSFGFKRLWSALLVSEKDPSVTIDVEMYDHGSAPNALGAYSGEREPTAKLVVSDTGIHHLDRNALYAARGPYYLRVIGSDESPAIKEKLTGLADVINKAVPGEALPWAYGLFVGELGLDPGTLSYFKENAFSFGFARDVWTARPGGKDSDLELFVAARADAKAAKALAGELHKGFSGLGQPAGKVDGVTALKDQFLNTFTGVSSEDRFVIGARGAADKDALAKELGRLRKGISGAPAELKARAQGATPEAEPAPAPKATQGEAAKSDYEGGDGEH